MPDETINYKVNIDGSDIATQLDQIRSQIDNQMLAMAMSAPGGGPASFGSPIMPQAPAMEMNPYNTINAVSGAFAEQMVANDVGGARGMGAFIEGTSQAFALGYGKFERGIRQMGMMTEMPPLIRHSGAGLDSFTLNMEALQNAPLFTGGAHPNQVGSIAGSMGFGWDKYSPITYQEHVDASRQRLAETIGDLGSGFAGTVAGAAAGAAVGAAGGAGVGALPGFIAGAAVGLGFDALTAIGGTRTKQANAVGSGLQQIASHSLLGSLGKEEAATMARRLLDTAGTPEGINSGLTRDEIQEDLLGFASGGGYENVRTAEEFERVSKDVITNARKV